MNLYKKEHFWYFDFVMNSFLLYVQRKPTTKLYEDPYNSCFKIYTDWEYTQMLRRKYEKI